MKEKIDAYIVPELMRDKSECVSEEAVLYTCSLHSHLVHVRNKVSLQNQES